MTFKKLHKYASIGMRLQSIRSLKGLSQTKFSANIGISQRFLSDLESGKIKPSKPILLSIEYVYGYRWEWILTGDEPSYKYTPGAGALIITPPDQQEITDKKTVYWSKYLGRIIREGDKTKVDAIINMLKALDPGKIEARPLEEEEKKKA